MSFKYGLISSMYSLIDRVYFYQHYVHIYIYIYVYIYVYIYINSEKNYTKHF